MGSVQSQRLRVLIVEDEPLIAADLEMMISDMGHEVVGLADSKDSALPLIASEALDAAFVDLNLRDGFTGLEIASMITDRRRARVYFLTGNAELIPEGRCGADGVITKPYAEIDIETALAGALKPPRWR